jgi:hypothetical protein
LGLSTCVRTKQSIGRLNGIEERNYSILLLDSSSPALFAFRTPQWDSRFFETRDKTETSKHLSMLPEAA